MVLSSSGSGLGPVPLADARPTGVGQHGGADGLEVGEQSVALDGGPDLLGAGRDEERGLGPQPVGRGLPGDGGGPGHVLVGRVGARADQGGRDGSVGTPCAAGPRAHVADPVGADRACRGR